MNYFVLNLTYKFKKKLFYIKSGYERKDYIQCSIKVTEGHSETAQSVKTPDDLNLITRIHMVKKSELIPQTAL